MRVQVETPPEYTGPVSTDLGKRRGVIQEVKDDEQVQTIAAEVPLEQLVGYITRLRTRSSGRATASMQLARYAQLPNHLTEAVIR